jgi:uncharacterized protein
MRMIFDTEVLLAALLSKDRKLSYYFDEILLQRCSILICPRLLDEFRDAALHPAIRPRIGSADVDVIVEGLSGLAVKMQDPVGDLGEPLEGAELLLALAEKGKANYLFTTDRSLLDKKEHQGTMIRDPSGPGRRVAGEQPS